MTPADEDGIDALAGEYVLGTLAGDERRAAEARYAADPTFRAAVSAWERRLQPLADTAGETPAPPGTFDAILSRIGEAAPSSKPAPENDNVVVLRREVRRWRISTALLGAAAAALAGIVVVDRLAPVAPQQEFVAVLTAEGAKPAFVATVDVAKGTLSVRRVVDAPPGDKSYELWAVVPDQNPTSLGVFQQASLSGPIALPADGAVTLAISLEPSGGSKTGAPTGPVVFTGELVPAE